MLLGVLALVACAGGIEYVQRSQFFSSAPPLLAEARTPRIAVLPFTLRGDDKDLAALGRAFDEHLQTWLRSDPNLAAVPRRRTLAALARAAPDMQGDALLRQLPDVARAANASILVRGDLRYVDQGFVLELSLDQPGTPKSARNVRVQGADAASLFAAYVAAAPAWLKSVDVALGSAPPLPSSALAAYGRGLIAYDSKLYDAAVQELSRVPAESPSTLVALATLGAQEAAQQQLPAQATRDAIARAFAGDPAPQAREALARALAGSDKGGDAVRVLADALHRYPHDDQLVVLEAETLSEIGNDKRAIEVLRQLVKDDDQDAHAWFLLGRSAIKQGDAQSAVDDYLVHALILNTRAGNDAAVAEANNAIGAGYERLGQTDAAVDQYTRAAAMQEKLDDRKGLAKSLRNLAIVQAERGDRAAADKTLDRVKTLLEALGDRASIADLYNDRGVVAEEHGDLPRP